MRDVVWTGQTNNCGLRKAPVCCQKRNTYPSTRESACWGSAIRHEWHPLGARDGTCTRDGMTMSVSHESVKYGIVESDTF